MYLLRGFSNRNEIHYAYKFMMHNNDDSLKDKDVIHNNTRWKNLNIATEQKQYVHESSDNSCVDDCSWYDNWTSEEIYSN